MKVECPECEMDVKLPNGLALCGYGDNPQVKGVSCPFCPEVIDAKTVEDAISSAGL